MPTRMASHATSADNCRNWDVPDRHRLLVLNFPGQGFYPHTHQIDVHLKASILFRACFLGSLPVAVTVSVRVPARNPRCPQEDHWRDFSKCSVCQERAELSGKAKHEGRLVSGSCHYWPGKDREGGSRGQGKRLPQQPARSLPTTGLWEGPGDTNAWPLSSHLICTVSAIKQTKRAIL